ncbi:MAG TPA: hypothetical protein VK656_00935 [Candidatus Acidoferrum sp.]|nr:hypothetical protein [Candidatus Acidoferrum sp.]
MTDYQRTTVQRTVDDPAEPAYPAQPAYPGGPVVDPTPAPRYAAPVVPAAMRTSVVTEHETVRPSGALVVRRAIALVFGIIQALLVLRIVLLLLIANHNNDIVSGILGITGGLVEPFRGMFSLDRIRADSGSVFDVAAVVALVGWTLIEALILAVIRLGDRPRTATE